MDGTDTLMHDIDTIHACADLPELKECYTRLVEKSHGDHAAIWAIQEATCAKRDSISHARGDA